jgi:hypothetical protein
MALQVSLEQEGEPRLGNEFQAEAVGTGRDQWPPWSEVLPEAIQPIPFRTLLVKNNNDKGDFPSVSPCLLGGGRVSF